MRTFKVVATAPCCLLLLCLLQEGSASFRLLQDETAAPAAAPGTFEAAEAPPTTPESGFGAAPEEAPEPELFSPPEDYTPPEDESYDPADFEEAAFPSGSPEGVAAPGETAASPQAPNNEAAYAAQGPDPVEDPRDRPCAEEERTQLKQFFKCDNFDGYYCLTSQFGATGGNCEGDGQYRCEPLSSEPSLYGIIASYPTSSAIGNYCTSSFDCHTDQFCDKAPQREYNGDVPVGNCVAYLVQGCLG